MSRNATPGFLRERDGYQRVNECVMKTNRRSLVLTDEAARHPFRANLPPHVLGDDVAVRLRSRFFPTRDDVRGFASAYFATLAAALVFLA